MTYEKWRARLANTNDEVFIPITTLDAMLTEGSGQFWATPDAAMVTHITPWPGGAVCIRVIAAAGKRSDLVGPLKTQALDWAKAQGCTHAMIEGRAGWQKAHPDFEFYQTTLVKEL